MKIKLTSDEYDRIDHLFYEADLNISKLFDKKKVKYKEVSEHIMIARIELAKIWEKI